MYEELEAYAQNTTTNASSITSLDRSTTSGQVISNGEVATDPDGAGQLASSVRNNPEQAIANLQSASSYFA